MHLDVEKAAKVLRNNGIVSPANQELHQRATLAALRCVRRRAKSFIEEANQYQRAKEAATAVLKERFPNSATSIAQGIITRIIQLKCQVDAIDALPEKKERRNHATQTKA